MARNTLLIFLFVWSCFSCSKKIYRDTAYGPIILNDVKSVSHYTVQQTSKTGEAKLIEYDSFDFQGNLTFSKTIHFQPVTREYVYTADGSLIQSISNGPFGNGELRYHVYDNEGRTIVDSTVDREGNTLIVALTSYNKKGDTLTTSREWSGPKSLAPNWKTIEIEKKLNRKQVLITTFLYDEFDKLERRSYELFSYFASGNLRRLQEWSENPYDSSSTYFNKKGFCTYSYNLRKLFPDSFWISEQHYQVDRNGNRTKMLSSDLNGEPTALFYKYQFDDKGNWIQQIVRDETGSVLAINKRKIRYYE